MHKAVSISAVLIYTAEVVAIKHILIPVLCVMMLSGCASSDSVKTDTRKPRENPVQLKSSYTNTELLRLSGYRKGAVQLPAHVKAPELSNEPTDLSIRLKAMHLVMNKGIKLKGDRLTDVEAQKAGYRSLTDLKAQARQILIKQNKELRPTISNELICSDAFSSSKITVTEKDRKTFRKTAVTELLESGKEENKGKSKKGKKASFSDDDVRKMLFVGEVIAKQHVSLSKKDMENGTDGNSSFSSYTGFYRNGAVKIAAGKALSAYCSKAAA